MVEIFPKPPVDIHDDFVHMHDAYICPEKLKKILDDLGVDENTIIGFDLYTQICLTLNPDIGNASLIASFASLDSKHDGYFFIEDTKEFWTALFDDSHTCEETMEKLNKTIENYEYLVKVQMEAQPSIVAHLFTGFMGFAVCCTRPIFLKASLVDGVYRYDVINMIATGFALTSTIMSLILQYRGSLNPIVWFYRQRWSEIRNIYITCTFHIIGTALYGMAFNYTPSLNSIICIQYLTIPMLKILSLDFMYTDLTPTLIAICLLVFLLLAIDSSATLRGTVLALISRAAWDYTQILTSRLLSPVKSEDELNAHCQLTDCERLVYFMHVCSVVMYPMVMIMPLCLGEQFEAWRLLPFMHWDGNTVLVFVICPLFIYWTYACSMVGALFFSVVFLMGNYFSLVLDWFLFDPPEFVNAMLVTVLVVSSYQANVTHNAEEWTKRLEHVADLQNLHQSNIEMLMAHDQHMAQLLMEIIQEEKEREMHELNALHLLLEEETLPMFSQLVTLEQEPPDPLLKQRLRNPMKQITSRMRVKSKERAKSAPLFGKKSLRIQRFI